MTREITSAEFVQHMYDTNAPQEIFEHALEIQQRDLNDWKKVLKRKCYKMLVRYVKERNKLINTPADTARGGTLSNFVSNINFYMQQGQYID